MEIFNQRVNEPGTLGFIARDSGTDPGQWLVTCYHVLVGGSNTQPVREAVLQPSSEDTPVAFVDVTRADQFLDCAAARLTTVAEGVPEILGLGPIIKAPAKPIIGTIVIKSGAVTGVTEGIINEIIDDEVIIAVPPTFDPEYRLSERGDSGSLWVRQEDLAPVALHLGEIGDPERHVRARAILPVLEALRLQF